MKIARNVLTAGGIAGSLLLLGMPLTEAGAATYTIKVSHAVTTAHAGHKALEIFKKTVEEKSRGEIEVRIFHSSQLAGQREGVEGLQTGTIEMTLTPNGVIASFDPTFALLDIPFLFDDLGHAHRFLDKYEDELLLKNLSKVGLVGLAVWEQGFRNLGTAKLPVGKVEDVKGLKLRTMQAPLHITAWKSLGANPTPIGWAEVYTSLQQGVIEGVENPSYIFSQTPVHEQIKYLSITKHIYDPILVLGSKVFFDRMPENLRAMVLETLRGLTATEREMANADVKAAEAVDLPGHGVKILEISAEEQKRLAAASQPAVLRDVESKVGKDAVARWMAAVGATRAR